MKKYTILLPVLSYASAFNLSRKHSECTERCKQLPFKVAVESRRSDCIKNCAPKVYDDALSQSAADRDEQCVNDCKDKKGSKRFKTACILRCPESLEIDSVRMMSQQNDHVHQNEVHSDAVLNITNVTLTNPVSRSSKNENGTFNRTTVARDNQDDAHVDAEQNGTNVSLADLESHLPEKEEDGTFKASTVANATYEISNEDDKNTTYLKHIASSNSTAQGVEIITTLSSTINFESDDNTTAIQKPNISEVTTNLNTPGGAQVNHTPNLVNSTRSLTTPSHAPDAVLDSSSRVSHEETSLSTRDACVAKCNEKRTLQRKRDACIKRCDSWASSSSASTLARGYGSVKLEL